MSYAYNLLAPIPVPFIGFISHLKSLCSLSLSCHAFLLLYNHAQNSSAGKISLTNYPVSNQFLHSCSISAVLHSALKGNLWKNLPCTFYVSYKYVDVSFPGILRHITSRQSNYLLFILIHLTITRMNRKLLTYLKLWENHTQKCVVSYISNLCKALN